MLHCGILPERVLRPSVLVVGAGGAARGAVAAVLGCGVDVLLAGGVLGGVPGLDGVAWGAFAGPEVAVSSATCRYVVRPLRLILAEEGFEAGVPVPGWELPGCMGAGAGGGGGVVFAGSGASMLVAAARRVLGGGGVVAVVEASPEPRWVPGARVRAALAVLRRAGVPVLWGTRVVRVLGKVRAEGVLVSSGERIGADGVALHWGVQAETGLARALGVPHRVVDGQLRAETDREGASAVPGVFVVDAPGGEARGRAAGFAVVRSLGVRAPGWPGAALARAAREDRRLGRAFRAQRPDTAELADATVVCPCEGVTAGGVRRAMAEGAASLATVKRATRAGMGVCGGRLCGVTVGRLCGASAEAGFAAPRVPVRPIVAGVIMADHADPADAVLPAPAVTRWATVPAGPLPEGAAVVVIGGGIVGLAAALYLAREGVDVLVVDRGEPGMAASTANAGSLHVQLVPYVYAAGGGPMADALPLGPASVGLWRELARDANEDLGLRTEGGLVLAESEAELALLRDKTAFERSRGVPCEVVGPGELRAMAPGLDGRFAGAAYCPGEGQGDPLRGTMALLALARRAGVRFAAGVEVLGLERAGAGWLVRTGAGVVRAGQVVNAAGVQAGRIGALAGVAVPVHALVQQVVATEAAAPMLRQLVAWTGRHLSLKQGNGGHLLVGGGWPGTQDAWGAAQVRRESLEGNLALAAAALPGLRNVRVVRAWTGLAPTLARAPVISGSAGAPGLWHGVTGNGYTLGPVVGRMLADAVKGRGLPGAFGL